MRRFFWGLIFLILWDTVCIYWFVCGIKNLCEQPQQEVPVVAVVPSPPLAPVLPPAEPKIEPEPEPVKPLILTDVYFISDSYIVKNMEDLLYGTQQAIEYLSKNPESKVYITGHTNRGEDYYLSSLRAKVIKHYMISKGVPDNIFILESKGSIEPKAPDDTPENKMLNRRVNITVK